MPEFKLDDNIVLWRIFEAIRGAFYESKGKATLSFDAIKRGKNRMASVIEVVIPGSSCAEQIQKLLESARDGVEDEAQRHN